MPHPPTLLVNTNGDKGGFHAYYVLAEPFRIGSESDRQNITECARRWNQKLIDHAGGKLDSTANLDRMLRVIGQQRSPKGARVTTRDYDPAASYHPRDLWISQERPAPRVDVAPVAPIVSGSLGDGPITQFGRANGLTPVTLLREAGYTHISGRAWKRPGKTAQGVSVMLATEREGVICFSDKDPHFASMSPQGSPGAFYSLEAMFVAIRFAGDWKAAARSCGDSLLTGGR